MEKSLLPTVCKEGTRAVDLFRTAAEREFRENNCWSRRKNPSGLKILYGINGRNSAKTKKYHKSYCIRKVKCFLNTFLKSKKQPSSKLIKILLIKKRIGNVTFYHLFLFWNRESHTGLLNRNQTIPYWIEKKKALAPLVRYKICSENGGFPVPDIFFER